MKHEFHNTIRETGTALKEKEGKAMTQREIVLQIFTQCKGKLSPSEVLKRYPKAKTPLTSIRRAISNLTRDNILEKINEKRTGLYNTDEHYWQLKSNNV